MALRITTLALFASINPTLASGDCGMESDTGHYKIGDGVTAWNNLTYFGILNHILTTAINDLNIVGSSFGSKVASKSADYSMVYTDGTILVTTSTTNRTITLPSGQTTAYTFNGNTFYRIYNIKKVDSGSGLVACTPASGTIDGLSSYDLTEQNESASFQYDGTTWRVLSHDFDRPCAQISDTTTQTIASITTEQAITFNTNDLIKNITHSTSTNTSRVYVNKTGNYEINFKAQCDSTIANKVMYFWLRVNGVDVPRTTTTIEIVNANDQKALTIEYNQALVRGDYFEVYFGADSTGCSIPSIVAGVSPTRPVTPSGILTVEYV